MYTLELQLTQGSVLTSVKQDRPVAKFVLDLKTKSLTVSDFDS